jgi:hypothetical protein
MTIKNILLVLSIIAYTCLFYQQTSGINFLIFTLIVITSMTLIQPNYWANPHWRIVAIGAILSAAMIVVQHSILAIVANLCSLILLAGISYNHKTSLFIGIFQGCISYFFSFFINVLDWLLRVFNLKANEQKTVSLSLQKITAFYLIPISITLLFLGLYASANPLFKQLFYLPNISIDLCYFCFTGWVVCTGFIYPFSHSILQQWDDKHPNTLMRIRKKIKKNIGGIALKIESQKGIIMLSLLNFILLLFHIVDFNFIFSGQQLPSGMDYSEYVHQGVNTLIFSILLAIGIIIYFFRGNQNFYPKNQWLIRLTYGWIIQNGILLISIIYKNQRYIHAFGLTYKRIGVYVYLLLTLIGLITTFWKIQQRKTTWFLFRINTLIAYILLIISSFFNWDSSIANYNIKYAKTLDITYLLNLSNNVLPELQSLLNTSKINLAVTVYDYTSSDKFQYNRLPPISQRAFILAQIALFKQEYPTKNWQSWNYADQYIFNQLTTHK